MRSMFILLVLVAAFGSASAGDPPPSNMDIGCVTKHCPLSFAEAIVDPTFLKDIACEESCNPYFYNSTSIGRLEYQNCTTKCALTYDTPVGDKFIGCAMTNNCMTFLPLNVTCPAPEPGAASSLADLTGEWWQQYGKNKLWDAYPCQHIHEMKMVKDDAWCGQTIGPKGPVKSPCWSYTYSYDLYTNDGTKYFQQTWQLPADTPKGAPIDIYYQYMGSTHNETWYILDSTDNYVILLDCSYMSGWTNVGSILWVRPETTLTDQEMSDIARVYKAKTGWNFPEDFVTDTHGAANCDGPTEVYNSKFDRILTRPMRWDLRL